MMDMLLLIFCAKPKFEEHTLRLQVDGCNAGNHSVIGNRQGVLNNHRQNEGKYPEDSAFRCGPRSSLLLTILRFPDFFGSF